jgi:hypothetical protein
MAARSAETEAHLVSGRGVAALPWRFLGASLALPHGMHRGCASPRGGDRAGVGTVRGFPATPAVADPRPVTPGAQAQAGNPAAARAAGVAPKGQASRGRGAPPGGLSPVGTVSSRGAATGHGAASLALPRRVGYRAAVSKISYQIAPARVAVFRAVARKMRGKRAWPIKEKTVLIRPTCSPYPRESSCCLLARLPCLPVATPPLVGRDPHLSPSALPPLGPPLHRPSYFSSGRASRPAMITRRRAAWPGSLSIRVCQQGTSQVLPSFDGVAYRAGDAARIHR